MEPLRLPDRVLAVKAHRERLAQTQREVYEAAGIDKQRWSEYENDTWRGPDTLVFIARALNIVADRKGLKRVRIADLIAPLEPLV